MFHNEYSIIKIIIISEQVSSFISNDYKIFTYYEIELNNLNFNIINYFILENVSLAYEDSNRYHNDYDKKEQHKYYQHGIKSNNYYSTNDYNSRNNNNNKDTHQSQNGRNVKNFYKEYNHDEDTVRNFNRKSYQDKNELENQYKNEKNQDAKYNKVQLNRYLFQY